MTAPDDDAREALRVIRAARADGIKLWLKNGQVYAAPRGDKLERHRPALDKLYDAIAALLKENPRLGKNDRPPPSNEVPGPPSEAAKPDPSTHDPARGEDVPKPRPEPETEPGSSGAKPSDGAERDEAKSKKRHAKSRQPEPSRLNDSGGRVPITEATLNDALRAACAEVGIVYRDVPVDGRWHETDINGDPRGRGDGRIKLFPDGEGGIVCNWKGELRPFFVNDGRKLTAAERREHERKRAESIHQAQEELARRYAEAASKASAIWAASGPAPDNHPYSIRKHIQAHGLRLYRGSLVVAGMPCDGSLIVPACDGSSAIHTLEFIHFEERDGDNKRFLPGGDYLGRYFSIGAMEGTGPLCLCEGFATGASIREATGYPVAVAFNAGNLGPVAQALRARFPNSQLILCADDDAATDGPGLTKATEAARAVGGLVAVPDFGENRPEGATDFNDMAVLRGREAVRDAMGNAKALTGDEARPGVAGGKGQAGGATPPVSSKNGVTGVTGVPGLISKDFSCDPRKNHEVTGVTEPAENHSSKPEGSESAAKNRIPPPSKRPRFRVFERPSRKLKPAGVWFFGLRQPRKAEEQPTRTQQWVCSPLYIDAVTEDGQDNNFGRLLRFRNTLGRWRVWSMPMELLRGLGDEMRGELLAMGVEINPQSKTLLSQYLQSEHPERRVLCALQVGWCGGSFVLPGEVIGPGASDVIFQSGECRHDEYTCAGTLEGWQSGIAARAVGNPLLVQTLSASFAGPLLKRCNAEGGGLHFTGHSSIGKTAFICASCSTWGGRNFLRSWKATANGMEGAAAVSNDGLLALDEISESDPREVGAIVYALANGIGKQRASRTGSARPVTRWRCFVLSSGEFTIATHMSEGGRKAKAGQSVRLLDVPVSGKFGAWDNLHGFPSGAEFSDALKRAALTHYGHAGREFLENLTRDTRNFCGELERIKALPAFSVEGGEGQDKRAAARFALVALAGEVATEYGITGWPEGRAIEGAAKGLKAWRSLRGRGNDERWKILEALRDFIDRHGDSRFSSTEPVMRYGPDNECLGPDTRVGAYANIRDRAGWWGGDGDERIYLFTAEGMREALRGFDFQPALDTMEKAGVLPPADAEGKRSTRHRIPGRGQSRLYEIPPGKLEAPHEP